jgi:putative multiple sugar transport system substrate-binding protein
MSNKRRLIVVVIAFLLLVSAFLGGCSSSSKQTSEKKQLAVGIVLPTKDEPRWIQDETRFQDALKNTPYSAEILFSQGDPLKKKLM